MGKFWCGKKLVNLANCELFTKIFLANVHRYTENVFGMCTDSSLFIKIFLANTAFTCIVWFGKIFPAKVFLCMVFLNVFVIGFAENQLFHIHKISEQIWQIARHLLILCTKFLFQQVFVKQRGQLV